MDAQFSFCSILAKMQIKKNRDKWIIFRSKQNKGFLSDKMLLKSNESMP